MSQRAAEKPRDLSILLLGNTDRPEFCDAHPSINRWGTVAAFDEVDAAAKWLAASDAPPDAIVVAQAFPGQFSHQAIDGLRRLAPLAPLVGMAGSWCEGESRSGSPWTGAARIYWHQWAARCARELERLADGRRGSWTLPLTTTEEERLLADIGEPGAPRGRHGGADIPVCLKELDDDGRQECLPHQECMPHPTRGLVVIAAQSPHMAEYLSAACATFGLATVCQRRPITVQIDGAAAAVFDGTDLAGDEFDQLVDFVAALRPTPVVVLLGFPRIDQRDRALAAGAAAVISKPLLLDDLWWQLEQVIPISI